MTDATPVHRRWWQIRVPLGPLVIAYLLIVAVAAGGLELVTNQQEEFRQEVIRRDHERCLDTRDARQVLRDLVKLSDRSAGFDLTKVPGFEQLDEPTRQFFANLAAATTPATTAPGEPPPRSEFVKQALALLALPSCPSAGEQSAPTASTIPPTTGGP